jgi:hypothetical protein
MSRVILNRALRERFDLLLRWDRFRKQVEAETEVGIWDKLSEDEYEEIVLMWLETCKRSDPFYKGVTSKVEHMFRTRVKLEERE